MNRCALLLAVSCCLVGAAPLPAQNIEIIVTGGKHDGKNVPVCVPLSLPKAVAERDLRDRVALEIAGHPGQLRFGQVTAPGLMTEAIPPAGDSLVRRDLHFILDELKAGTKLTVLCGFEAQHGAAFRWKGTDTLLRANRKDRTPPILKYMHAAYDRSTPEQRNRTYKVFHHLYDPAGDRLVTNGGHTDPYTDAKKLLYPHHRGLMYAFNRIRYGEGLSQMADTWHAQPGDTHEQHEKVLRQEAGFVLGRHRVLISWRGPKDDVFALEERELTAYNVPGGTLVEFASRLKTTDGKVRLDGDPQHAGFQFRAANEVAEKTAKQTYYLRPDGKGEAGATRNWEPKTKKGPVDLPWDVMSFVVGDQRYSVCYLNSPANPKESRFSERDYGRFGCYFAYDLTKDRPLVVNYRVWLQDGEMTGTQAQRLYDEFAHPAQAVVGK